MKDLALLLASAVLCGILLEGSIRLLDLFPDARRAAAPVARAAPETGRQLIDTQLHPFLGWSHRPGSEETIQALARRFFPEGGLPPWTLASLRRNVFGHPSAVNDYRDVGAEDFVVGLFGGSVASNLASVGGDALHDRLEERFPSLAGSVVVLNVGTGGYKQPQQLIELVEMGVLGIRFDLVINVDGFNEVVFGAEDSRSGHHPLFPSRFHYGSTIDLGASTPSADTIETAAAALREERAARGLARLVSGPPLCWSELVRAVGGAIVLRHQRRAIALQQELAGSAGQSPQGSAIASLWDRCLPRKDDCYELMADLWVRSSLVMADVARGMGAEYVHVLQPNQYVEESKPLSPEERVFAFAENAPYVPAVRRGYQHLRRHGERLEAAGVAFHDLSMLFADRPETLYADDCCHLNLEGNALLARAIADRVRGPGVRSPAPGR